MFGSSQDDPENFPVSDPVFTSMPVRRAREPTVVTPSPHPTGGLAPDDDTNDQPNSPDFDDPESRDPLPTFVESEWNPKTMSVYRAVLRRRKRRRELWMTQENFSRRTTPTPTTHSPEPESDEGRLRQSLLSLADDCFSYILSFCDHLSVVFSLRLTCREMCRFFDERTPEAASPFRFHFASPARTVSKISAKGRVSLRLVDFCGEEPMLPTCVCRWVGKLVIGQHCKPYFESDAAERKRVKAQRKQDEKHRRVFLGGPTRTAWRDQLLADPLPRNGRLEAGMESVVVSRFPDVHELWIDQCSSFGARPNGGFGIHGWILRKLVLYDCKQIASDGLRLRDPEALRVLKIENYSGFGGCAIDGAALKQFWPRLESLFICRIGSVILDEHLRGFQKLRVLVLHDMPKITNSAFDNIVKTVNKLDLFKCPLLTPSFLGGLVCAEHVLLRECGNFERNEVERALSLSHPLPRLRFIRDVQEPRADESDDEWGSDDWAYD